MDNIPVKSITLSDLTENIPTRVAKSIKQKDLLIKSLKSTIESMTNIILNHSKNIEIINENITDHIKTSIDDNLLDKYFNKLEEYVNIVSDYKEVNVELSSKLNKSLKDSELSNSSYEVLNNSYINYIIKSKNDNKVLIERISNLSKTIDSLKKLHEEKTNNLRTYYIKELNKQTDKINTD
tara:strand:- start:227 stop:769 length:543 start_codon:yes stop_codon:yes gene_type:complete